MTNDLIWKPITIKLASLQPWERNPKTITKSHATRLLKNWKALGQWQTLAIGPSGEVYDGHQRLSTLLAAYGGEYEVYAMQSSRPLSDDERGRVVFEGTAGAVGQFDWERVASFEPAALMEWGLEADTLKDWKRNTSALENFLNSEQPELVDAEPQIDRAEELRGKWQVETGQLWQIGEHRLLCGDSTKKNTVDIIMGGTRAALCVTDPPYNVRYDPQWRVGVAGGGKQEFANGGVIENDDNTEWIEAFDNIPADVLYCWMASVTLKDLIIYLENVGFVFAYLIIWNKDLAVFGRGDYHQKHEPCLYMVRKGKNHNWQGDRKQETVWDIPTIHSFANGHSTEEWGLVGHGNQKPIECMARPILNNSKDGEVIYEPFAGSGTTLVACQNLGRKCRAIEISPAYCAVILERMATAFPGIDIKLLQPIE